MEKLNLNDRQNGLPGNKRLLLSPGNPCFARFVGMSYRSRYERLTLSYYIHILARQSPFEYGKDPLGRVLFSCNFDCRAVYPVANFINEMAKLVIDSGLGVGAISLFIGPQAEIPSGDGPYTTLKQTGGFASDESHNSEYLNLGLQVIVVAQDYDAGDTRAKAIHNLLNKKRSFSVTV